MKRKIGFLMLCVIAALGVLRATPAAAQGGPQNMPAYLVQIPGVTVSYVHVANGVPGVLYAPVTPGPKSAIGLFVMHADGDYLTFSACSELSKRGYVVLCVNNSTSKSGVSNDGALDQVLLQAKASVIFLRNYPGIKKVVLFGHSGGATIMTAYQDIAENGVKVCQDAEKIHKCPDTLAGMPPADGVVLADANWGQAEMVLLSVDPSVVGEDGGMKTDPDLDMYNPKNGITPTGANFSPAFIQKFLSAEGKRNNAIIKQAQDRLALIEAGKGLYTDDEPFVVPGAFVAANKLFAADTQLLSHTKKPWPLLLPDGTSVTQIIHSVRVPETQDRFPSNSMMRGAMKTTVRNYLSSYAIRVDDDFGYGADGIHGVEWTSSYASPPGNIEGVKVPLVAVGMTGHWEGLAAEEIYNHAASTDKTLAFVEGATHTYTPCKPCERTPGEFGDTVKTLYNYVDGWLSKPGRFL